MSDEQRLHRIEQKLDKLTEAVSQIARVEEQMLSVFKRIDRHEKRLDEQEDYLRDLTNKVLSNSHSVKAAERFFWVGVATVASAIGYLIR